jgi:hypothetical protein
MQLLYIFWATSYNALVREKSTPQVNYSQRTYSSKPTKNIYNLKGDFNMLGNFNLTFGNYKIPSMGFQLVILQT